MRKYFVLFLMASILCSCNDGNVDFTTFNYDQETVLQQCGTTDKVIYNINNTNIHEAISLKIASNSFPPLTDTITSPINTISISLTENGGNTLIYRTFDGQIPSDYFCNSIPPSSPRVLQEYRATGGTVKIDIVANDSDDLDHDGIPNSEERMDTDQDTDGDGIPDYLDVDDDGDNVTTIKEAPDPANPRDTDEDGTPNYLDPDDDNDGVPTRLEITQSKQDPATNINDAGTLPKYLDEFSADEFTGEIKFKIVNSFSRGYTALIRISNVPLKNETGDGGEIRNTDFTLGTLSLNYQFKVIPTPTTTEGEN